MATFGHIRGAEPDGPSTLNAAKGEAHPDAGRTTSRVPFVVRGHHRGVPRQGASAAPASMEAVGRRSPDP